MKIIIFFIFCDSSYHLEYTIYRRFIIDKLEMADPRAEADREEENARTRELGRLRGIKCRAKRNADPQRRVVYRELERLRSNKFRAKRDAAQHSNTVNFRLAPSMTCIMVVKLGQGNVVFFLST